MALPIGIGAKKSKSALGRRTIVSKFATSPTITDEDKQTEAQTPPSPAEDYFRRTGKAILTMEEKLASYRSLKEAADRRKNSATTPTKPTIKKSTTTTATTKRTASSKTIVPSANQSRLSFGKIETILPVATTTKEVLSESGVSNDISAMTPPQSEDFMSNYDSEDESLQMPPNDDLQERHALNNLRQEQSSVIEEKNLHNISASPEEGAKSRLRSRLLASSVVIGERTQTTVHTENIPNKSLLTRATSTSSEGTEYPLPKHLSTLYTIFDGLEAVLTHLSSQRRNCFYHQHKKHVERHCGRNFELKHLAQFVTVMPEAYTLTTGLCLIDDTRGRSIMIKRLDLKEQTSGEFRPETERRRAMFRERLLDHVKTEHEAFLQTTKSKGKDLAPGAWHEGFDLEKVSEIKESSLPEYKAAVVDIRSYGISIPSKSTVSSAGQKGSLAIPVSTPGSSVSTTVVSPAAARAKETLAAVKARMIQTHLDLRSKRDDRPPPEELHRQKIAQRLPSVFDIILFKRVNVTPVGDLTTTLVKSSRQPISEQEGQESLEMMAKVLPEWCTIFKLPDGISYFKVLKVDSNGKAIVHSNKVLRSRLVEGGRP